MCRIIFFMFGTTKINVHSFCRGKDSSEEDADEEEEAILLMGDDASTQDAQGMNKANDVVGESSQSHTQFSIPGVRRRGVVSPEAVEYAQMRIL